MWLAYACASAFFAGICAIFAKTGIKRTNATLAAGIRLVVLVSFSWLMVWVTGTENMIWKISSRSWLFLILSGLTLGASLICSMKALQLGAVNQVVPVEKLTVAVSMLFGLVLFREGLTQNEIAALVIIIAGVLFMIIKQASGRKGRGNAWLLYAALSVLFAAMTGVIARLGAGMGGTYLENALQMLVALVMAWCMVWLGKKQKQLSSITFHDVAYISLSGIALGLSWICIYRALKIGEAGIVNAIAEFDIIVAVLFAAAFLNERLTKKAFLGLVLIVAGSLLLLNHTDISGWIQTWMTSWAGKVK